MSIEVQLHCTLFLFGFQGSILDTFAGGFQVSLDLSPTLGAG